MTAIPTHSAKQNTNLTARTSGFCFVDRILYLNNYLAINLYCKKFTNV